MKNLNEYLRLLIRVRAGLNNPTEAIKKSLNNVHSKGLFSLVVNGEENGKLLRVFIADKKLKPLSVQLHSHRYPINLVPINGNIVQYEAIKCTGIKLSQYKYKSFLNGGSGLVFDGIGNYAINSYNLPLASVLYMTENHIHTVSCSKGSIWIVEELGFKTDESTVLGVPFTVDGLYTEPTMFQINDKCQIVLKYVNQILNNYGL